MTVEKITIEDNVVQTGTALTQCCVAGHICQPGVIIIDAKPDTLLVVLTILTDIYHRLVKF